MTDATMTEPAPRRVRLWEIVPTLPAPRALALLAVEELAQNGRGAGLPSVEEEHPIDPTEIAARTGLSNNAAGTQMRELAKAGLVRRKHELSYDEGKPDAVPRVLVRYLPGSLVEERQSGTVDDAPEAPARKGRK